MYIILYLRGSFFTNYVNDVHKNGVLMRMINTSREWNMDNNENIVNTLINS